MSTTTPDESVLARALAESESDEAQNGTVEDDISLTADEVRELAGEIDHDSQPESELDDLELQVAHREWTVKGEVGVPRRGGEVEVHNFERTYVQKPLSFTAMLQFTGLIGEKISQAMSGPDGLTVDGILGEGDGLVMSGRQLLAREDFSSLDSFVKGLAKLAMYVPEVVEDCQCIWLRVPFHERPVVKEIWSRSPEDGGMSTSDGEEMLDVFLAQNYKEVEDFFVERLPRLARRVNKLRARKGTDSQPSRRSKPTQAGHTPSA